MNILTNIQTPFHEKFGVPRQPLLVEEAWGKLTFPKNDFFYEAFRGIENFSHLWLIFSFHLVNGEAVNGLVSPPRFEGKKKVGVFASRSPHRPNPLGLSVVRFDRLEILDHEVELWVKGVDLVNGTPILDIKPYIPYCDQVIDAKALLFEDAPTFRNVHWNCTHDGLSPELRSLIEKVIGLDPRPGQDKTSTSSFGVSVGGYNVKFNQTGEGFTITELTII
jgi:tRNA (adenine37-N6)-methyltransferase